VKRLAVLAVAAAALLVPSTAFAGGVVLKVQQAAHLVAVAQSPAKVTLVRTNAAGRLRVGERVTFSAGTPRVIGHVSHVQFRGFLLKSTPTRMTVSAGGAPVTLIRHDDNHGQPAPGTTVEVSATVGNNNELDDDNVTPVSATQPGGALEGALTIGTTTVTVVSEHIALVLNVPTGFDLSAFRNGDDVLAVFAQQPDGTLTLTSLTGEDQGDQGDDGGGDNSGGGGGGGDDGGGGGDG
jgi:hypothetical protein